MKLTVYDFDKTIYDGDSSVDFIKFLISKKKCLIFRLPIMLFYLIKYKLKMIKKEEMKECFFSILSSFDSIDDLIYEFWVKHEKNIKDFFKNDKSKNIIIASASPRFLLEPIANKYKVKYLFASPIDRKNGKYRGINCHGEEKIRLINKKYSNAIIDKMYSDDIKSDKPLLELANESYVVKGNQIIDYELAKNKKPNILKRLWDFCWIIYHKNEEIWNYLIVGGLTTVVSLLVYYTCVLTFLDPNKPLELQIANIISWIKSNNKNIKKEAASFIGSRIITLLLDMLTMFIIVTLLHMNDKIGKIVSQIIVMVGNYIISKLFVFRKSGEK